MGLGKSVKQVPGLKILIEDLKLSPDSREDYKKDGDLVSSEVWQREL